MSELTQEEQDQFGKLIVNWRNNPVDFVEQCLGVNEKNGYPLSTQQKAALIEVGKISKAKRHVAMWEKKEAETEPSPEDFEYAKKMGLSIMSGKGNGKDALASFVILWFLCVFDEPLICCTAPTDHQLKTILWGEVARWHSRKAKKGGQPMFKMANSIQVEAKKIFMKGVVADASIKDGLFWAAFPRVPQKNVDEATLEATMSGKHAENMLFIVDEASGVPDAVIRPLENTMTFPHNFCLMIFNPHKNTGYAIETQTGKFAKQWVRLQWSAEDSELVSKQQILNMEEKYGRNHDNFRVNVQGLPPKGGDGSLIPYQWIYEAYIRESEVDKARDIVMGVDIAGVGVDKTIVTIRQGYKVLEQVQVEGMKLDATVDGILDLVMDYEMEKGHTVKAIIVDADGIGGTYYDELKKRSSVVKSFKGSNGSNKSKYKNQRAEYWFRLRELFESGLIDIPEDTELREELGVIGYDDTGKDIVIEDKRSIKKKLGRSPDKADSLMMSFYINDYVTRDQKNRYHRDRKLVGQEETHSEYSWLY